MKKKVSVLMASVMAFSLVGCSNKPEEKASEGKLENKASGSFTAGKYIGKAEGHNGELEVEVEFSNDEIVAINILNSGETEHISRVAFDVLPSTIIENQSLKVDNVTGATVTSSALKAAVKDAVVKADGDPAVLNKDIEKDTKSETVELTADVVVVGGGSAGLSAALSAEQQGLSVILIEKNAMLGGHTAFSGGLSLVTGSEFQKEQGVTDDTPQKAYDDLFVNGGDKSVPELLTLYSENMGVATDWSFDYVGAPKPESLVKLGENTVDRGIFYVGGGAGLIDAMAEKLEETTVDLHLDTRAKALITEGNDVIGVEAEAKDGTKYIIKANSTVLATGGYAARKDLLPKELDTVIYYGAALSSGDGLDMGTEVGADTVNMGYVELFENGVEWQPGIAKSTYNGSMAAWNESGILVDRKGERVTNERGSGISIVKKQQEQEDGTLFLLMDQKTFDKFSENIGGTGISDGMLKGWIENNGKQGPMFANAANLEEVGKIAGVDAEGLKATIEKYNSYVENGKDEEFGRPAEFMNSKIGDGPYYLVEQRPRFATTLGGLLVNDKLEVINTDGGAIKGLYAIGDTAGGVRGDDSVPGSDVGWAVTSGYLLGDILSKIK